MNECNTELLQEIFTRGLSKGLGAEDDQVCVEAAVALACGEPFSDRPTCVAEPDRTWAIKINDGPWSSPEARAKALLPLALAQLGTAGKDRTEWVAKVVKETIRRIVPKTLRAVAERYPEHSEDLLSAAQRCEDEGSLEAANVAAKAAYAAANAAALAANYAADAAAHAVNAAAYAAADAAARIVQAAGDAVGAAESAADWTAYAANHAAYTADHLGASGDETLQEAVNIALEAYNE